MLIVAAGRPAAPMPDPAPARPHRLPFRDAAHEIRGTVTEFRSRCRSVPLECPIRPPMPADLPSSPNYAANAVNLYTTANGSTLPVPAYDDDGDLTRGPLPVAQTSNATRLWDAENRLVKVAKTNGDVIATFDYDCLGRGITKTAWTGGSAGPTTLYLCDGFNCIAEYTGTTPALAKSYTWGIDLSGSMQGTGGVGGLLSVASVSVVHYPTYDGNGNVSEYLPSSGVIPAAHFEYDLFGNTVVDSDTKGLFTYRISTKPLDSKTGLYYYTYRYLDPVTGRWPSRDPIEEGGGENLYGYVRNDGINRIDYLGMSATNDCCDGQQGVQEVTDDAGRKCCKDKLKQVMIRVRAKKTIGDTGHVFVTTPSRAMGFYPGNSWYSPAGGPGKVIDQLDRNNYTPKNSYTYNACPESVDKLNQQLDEEYSRPKQQNYNALNLGGENCAGWACEMVQNAGFVPPYNPGTPLIVPRF